MKKFKKNTLTVLAASFLMLSLTTVTGCGGDNGEGTYTGAEGTPEYNLKLGENLFNPKGEGTRYFAPYLLREDGKTYANTKDAALIQSGEKFYLSTYGLPADYEVGLTVENPATGEKVDFSIGEDGKFTAPTVTAETTYNFVVFGNKEGQPQVKKTLKVTVVPADSIATGWKNFSGKNGDEREKMTAVIEEYMLNQGLSPLTYMNNAGYQLYNARVHSPFLDAGRYIPGYGYGILTYGSLSADLDAEQTAAFKRFYHQQEQAESDIGSFNYLGSNAGAVADFYDYISSSYFGTFVNQDMGGTHYEGILSRENAPIAVNPDENGASTTWKVKLRVGGDTADATKGVTPGLAYRSASTHSLLSPFNGRNIELRDYLTPFKLLATQAVGYYRGSEQAGENTANRQVKGFAEFYKGSKNLTELPTDAEIQAALGVKIDETDNSITIQFNGKITPDYAEYQIDGLWANPIPEDFLKALGGGNALNGSKIYGGNGKVNDINVTPLDTILSVGPYYTSYYESKKTCAFAKNEAWPKKKDDAGRDLYQIAGVHLNINSALTNNENETIEKFEAGLNDTSNIPASYWDKYVSDARRKKVDASGLFQWFLQTIDRQFQDERFPESEWEVKPAMSNNNFYKALISGVDRNAIAEYYHRSGTSFEMQEPVNKSTPKSLKVYNESDAHKQAVTNAMGDAFADPANYKEVGADFFEQAILEELDAGHYKLGTPKEPTKIEMKIAYVESDSMAKRFQLITDGWKEAFDLAVKSHKNSQGKNDWVKGGKPLITLDPASLDFPQESDTQMQNDIIFDGVKAGKYEGEGVYYVSGNPYDVLNNIEKYKADDSSGFTLNYGPNTSLPSREIKYEGKYYSFEGLWAAANGGKILNEFGQPSEEFELGDKFLSVDYVGATEIDVKVEFSYFTEYVKNIEWYALDLDDNATPLDTVDNGDGTLTLKFKGDQLCDIEAYYRAKAAYYESVGSQAGKEYYEALAEEYKGMYNLMPVATYDFEIEGEVAQKQHKADWYVPMTKPAA